MTNTTLPTSDDSQVIHGDGPSPEFILPNFGEDFYHDDHGDVVPMPLQTYEIGLESRTSLETIDYEGIGTGWLERWVMSDGTSFDVLLGQPKRLRTNVPVIEDTSWTTQVLGFNEDSAREDMKLGLYHITKGPDRNGTSIPLSQSAHNTTVVLEEAAMIGYIDAENALVKGFSRGAMIGFGTIAYLEEKGVHVVYANLTDPCIASKFDLSIKHLLDMIENPTDVMTEAGTLAIEALRLMSRPGRLWKYRKTVDLSLEGGRQLVGTGGPLFTGEAGYLAHHLPADTQATICFFLNSSANQQKVFKYILRDHDGVEYRHPKGGHLTGMNKTVLSSGGARFMGVVTQLESEVDPKDIDYNLVHRSKVSS